MALTVQTNVSSLNAQRNLTGTMNTMQTALSRLSSGYRITKASDDAAGLAISESLRAQIRSMAQGQRNAYDGISVIQTAEGSLNEISNILIRMRELSMQSASDGVGTTERSYLQVELTALRSEIDRIANGTEFNGRKLIDGSLSLDTAKLTFQVGIRNTSTNDRMAITVASAKTADLKVNASNLSVTTKEGAQAALSKLDTALSSVSSIRARLGAYENRLSSTIANLAIAQENVSAANSRIRDMDAAQETSNLTKAQILLQAGVSVLAQANAVPQVALNLIR
jgi:flagellin